MFRPMNRRTNTRRQPPSRLLTRAQDQLGWYARNAFESEAQDDLLRPIRDIVTRLPNTTHDDAEDDELGLLEQSDKRIRVLLPVPGTKLHARLLQRIKAMLGRFEEPPDGDTPFEVNARYAATAFGLTSLEKKLLQLALRARRSAALREFVGEVCLALDEVPRAIAAVLGVSAQAIEGCLRPNERLLRCGLLQYEPGRIVSIFSQYGGGLFMPESMWIIMSTPFENEGAWSQAIIGRPVTSPLAWEDFSHVGEAAEMAWRLLDGAVADGTPGVHIMLAGPPGTGKSEFAAALAAKAGVCLYAVGETDDNKGEPNRGERLSALQASQAMLQGQSRVAILLDEAEDVLEFAAGPWRPQGCDLEGVPEPDARNVEHPDHLDVQRARPHGPGHGSAHVAHHPRRGARCARAGEDLAPCAAEREAWPGYRGGVPPRQEMGCPGGGGGDGRADDQAGTRSGNRAGSRAGRHHGRARPRRGVHRPTAGEQGRIRSRADRLQPGSRGALRHARARGRPAGLVALPLRPAWDRQERVRALPRSAGSGCRCCRNGPRTCSPCGSAAPKSRSPQPSPRRGRQAPCS